MKRALFAPLDVRAIFGSLAQAPQAELNRLMGIYGIYLKSIAETSIPEILRSRLDESDLVQEALLRGASQLLSIQGKTDAESAGWLRQILQNVIIDAVRHHSAQRRDLGQEQTFVEGNELPDASLCGEIERREELRRVAAALMELSAEQRTFVEPRSQGHTFEEVGRATGRSADAARMLWGRAIERLSTVVGDWTFVESDRGGQTAAVLYSVVMSVKANDGEPSVYVRDPLATLAEISSRTGSNASNEAVLRTLLLDVRLASLPEAHRRWSR